MNGINPHWNEFLVNVPETLQQPVIDAFTKWDQAYSTKVQETNQQYAPIKALVDQGYTLDDIAESVKFVTFFQENPDQVIQTANEEWNLGFTKAAPGQPEQAPNSNDSFDDLDLSDLGDIAKHPMFQALSQQVEALSSKLTKQEQEEADDAAIRQHEQYLDSLAESAGDFNRDIVTAFMARGYTGEQAIEAYREEIAKALQGQQPPASTSDADQQGSNNGPLANAMDLVRQSLNGGNNTPASAQVASQTPSAPPVLGASPTGSGLPQQSIDFGGMTNLQMQELVTQIAQQSGNDTT